jgi:Raf kinase inhibitor-like YbhB/YbcL family protein
LKELDPMPYSKSAPVPSFEVASETVADGARFSPPQWSGAFGVPGGQDASPQLSWSGFPAGTRSFAVTMFDPDAPIPSGFWHWGLVDIPAGVTSLPTGAGSPDADLPGAAFHIPMEAGMRQYIGAAPPAGTGRHRYFIAVHALDVDSVRDLGVDENTNLAVFHFTVRDHTLARAVMQAWADGDEGPVAD